MKYLLASTQMINTFSNFNAINMALTIKVYNSTPTLASYYAYIGYTPAVNYNVNFLSLTLESATQINEEEQDQTTIPVKDPQDTEQLKSTTTASNLLLLNMQILKDVIRINNLTPDEALPYKLMMSTKIPGAKDNTGSADIQEIDQQTADKQQLMSEKQQKKKTLQHLSTNTPILIDQNSRNSHYNKGLEAKELEILKAMD